MARCVYGFAMILSMSLTVLSSIGQFENCHYAGEVFLDVDDCARIVDLFEDKQKMPLVIISRCLGTFL